MAKKLCGKNGRPYPGQLTLGFEPPHRPAQAPTDGALHPGDAPLVIYTDGSCKGNPGPGGWGTLILAEGRETRLSGGEITTTNNRMELTAAIEALRAVRDNPAWKGRPVRLHIDSEYVRKGITGWISLWKTKDWRTSTRQPVKNRDLWEELDALNAGLSVEWVWVRGHDGDYYNEICDEMARFESARSKP